MIKEGNAVGEKGEEEILAIPAHLDSWTCKNAVDHVPGSAFGNRPQLTTAKIPRRVKIILLLDRRRPKPARFGHYEKPFNLDVKGSKGVEKDTQNLCIPTNQLGSPTYWKIYHCPLLFSRTLQQEVEETLRNVAPPNPSKASFFVLGAAPSPTFRHLTVLAVRPTSQEAWRDTIHQTCKRRTAMGVHNYTSFTKPGFTTACR